MRCFLDATNQRKQEANRVEMPRKLLLALRHVPRLRSVPHSGSWNPLAAWGYTKVRQHPRTIYITDERESVCV